MKKKCDCDCKYCGTSGRCYAKDLLGLRIGKISVKMLKARNNGRCQYGQKEKLRRLPKVSV